MVDEEGHAERPAGIAGRGLDPDLLERAFAEDPAVGHAVQGDAAGQAEVRQARSWRGRAGPSAA